MSVVLHVDGERWRSHLRGTADSRPGLVPVIKGNGYGFGNARLARKASWLGVDTVAVGTYAEVAEVASRFDGDIVVLTPWREFEAASLVEEGRQGPSRNQPRRGFETVAAQPPQPTVGGRLIHTVGRLDDLAALLATNDRPRVLLERMTSMKRHGFTARGLREATAMIKAHTNGPGVRVEGASIHLPLGGGSNLAEAETLLTDVVAAGLARGDDRGPAQIWISHLDPASLATLRNRYPEIAFRERVGTDLWLGDRAALQVRAHVLDLHPIERGEVYGYRGRTAPRSGTIVVVSGGTAHGIGLEAPTGDPGLRSRASSLARGGLDALGLAKSPFTIAGKARYFAEPPHMQSSMLFLPSGVEAPAVGDEVAVRVRFTATDVDSVAVS